LHQPHVRHMLLCDEVIADQGRITLINLMHAIKVITFRMSYLNWWYI